MVLVPYYLPIDPVWGHACRMPIYPVWGHAYGVGPLESMSLPCKLQVQDHDRTRVCSGMAEQANSRTVLALSGDTPTTSSIEALTTSATFDPLELTRLEVSERHCICFLQRVHHSYGCLGDG